MPTDSHQLRRMSGRHPHEGHRPATPLELLFDLTFVVAFGAAGNELAHPLGYEAIGQRHLRDHQSMLRA